MSKYAARIREHWEKYAPNRMKTLLGSTPEPETFFSELGAEIQGDVSSLAAEMARVLLAEMPEARDNYLQMVGLMTMARKIAEEVAMTHQLAWVQDPSMSLAEARQEWDDTRPMDDSLAELAYRYQDYGYPMYSTEELEEIAKEWAIPMPFLEGLLAAEKPYEFLAEHQEIMTEAANLRFLREVQ